MKALDKWWLSTLEIEAELLHGLHSQKMLNTDTEYIRADKANELQDKVDWSIAEIGGLEEQCNLRDELITELVDVLDGNANLPRGSKGFAIIQALIAKAKEFTG